LAVAPFGAGLRDIGTVLFGGVERLFF
jgi:hypothetical protein